MGAGLERLAVELRHLQRTEVREAEEYFAPGQKGSSAMPHKRNPVLSENVTGLARVIRGYVTPALENVVLWHERDIGHSSLGGYEKGFSHQHSHQHWMPAFAGMTLGVGGLGLVGPLGARFY